MWMQAGNKDWLLRVIAGCFGSGWTRWKLSWTRCWRGRLENTENHWRHYRTACRYGHKWLVGESILIGSGWLMAYIASRFDLSGILFKFKVKNVTLLGNLDFTQHMSTKTFQQNLIISFPAELLNPLAILDFFIRWSSIPKLNLIPP